MLNVNFLEVEELTQALTDYSNNTEETINNVLHSEEVNTLAQKAIIALMPKSNKKKGRHAKDSNSLRKQDGNLSVTIRTQKAFQYLYFPDDGSQTKRHFGNQRFFARGAENVQGEIVSRCKNALVNNI